MNSIDILKHGHQVLLESVDGLAESDWYLPGACGLWSVKDIVAHLTSFEYILIDVLSALLGKKSSGANVNRFCHSHRQYNDAEVRARTDRSVAEVWYEYEDAHAQTLTLLAQIPETLRRQTGTLPWYGLQYSLEDFIVYAIYGHKREHSAQIGVFRDVLMPVSTGPAGTPLSA